MSDFMSIDQPLKVKSIKPETTKPKPLLLFIELSKEDVQKLQYKLC